MVKTERDVATVRVSKSLARLLVHASLPVRDERGTSPVIVALPSDSLASVVEKVSRSGAANVIVAYREKMVLLPLSSEHEFTRDLNVIGTESDIDMFVKYLEHQQTDSNQFGVESVAQPEIQAPLRELQYAF